MTHYLAVDLGAESGRVILGTLTNERLSLDELQRFPSATVKLPDGSLRWNVLQIYSEIKAGLAIAAKKGLPISSISVDSWAVDYVLLNRRHPQLSPPFHYRDSRNEISMRRVRQKLGDAMIFGETGIQFLPFNTLYQLAADQQDSPELLKQAEMFLTIADYMNYLLSGVACIDESNASTTQMFDPRTRQWSDKLIEAMELPRHIFPRIVRPATTLGPMLPAVAEECGLNDVQVIATCSHDTGAAVAAVPAHATQSANATPNSNAEEPGNWAYLSSGTWSLLGVELPAALINDRVREFNFTNEAGYGGTTRFLKNIVGLWILQECRRSWNARGTEINYADLNRDAEAVEPFRSLIDPADPRFAAPGQMPEKITAFCRETNQPPPQTPPQFTRCILESLSLLYRRTLEQVESLIGRSITRLHVVGGGSQSNMLNRFTADALEMPVLAGPVEASAIGNVLLQALALGHARSLEHVRAIVAHSIPVQRFEPSNPPGLSEARNLFLRLQRKQP